ncbi:MAG TPA: ATP-binding cassette domain-containing protein [Trueperaceae bacterium]
MDEARLGSSVSDPAAPAIVASELTRSFGSVEAVKGVSFEVAQGEFFALLGPNGAGKTTTVQMLTTLLRPTTGRARVFGADTVADAATVRAALGMVFQEPALDERLSARENLQIHAALYRIPRAVARSRIEEALEWASLVEVGKRTLRSFSGGMKRRLELARALMHRPRLLFLDEPTLGLDPQGRRHLWERIEWLRGRGLTVFMTTHYLQEAESCDRVGIIDDGRMAALGTPTELKESVGMSLDASLEDVFIELTGRQLRDEEAGARSRMLDFAKRGGEHTR